MNLAEIQRLCAAMPCEESVRIEQAIEAALDAAAEACKERQAYWKPCARRAAELLEQDILALKVDENHNH